MLKSIIKYIALGMCILLIVIACKNNTGTNTPELNEFGLPYKPFTFNPQTYNVKELSSPPLIDGKNTNKEWSSIKWSSIFTSEINGKIESNDFETKFKMGIYQDTLYLLSQINENQIWAQNTNQNSDYFKDNFFEIYINYNNNEYDFLNIKVNALGIVKEGFKHRQEGNHKDSNYIYKDLKLSSAVYIQGTINNPNDIDQYWQLELGLPLNLKTNHTNHIRKDGFLKMNFTRSRWPYVIVNGMYKKIINSNTGILYNGEQWQWANMWENPITCTELWGEVHVKKQDNNKRLTTTRRIKWELRNVYYAQKMHLQKHKRYAKKIAGLKDVGFDLSRLQFRPNIKATKNNFVASIKDDETNTTWYIDNSGSLHN